MTNELSIVDNAFPVTLQFIGANAASNATTDFTLAQGGSGFVVPANHVAYAVMLSASVNADITAGGTAAVKVIDDGTELADPVVTLVNGTQTGVDLARKGALPIAAGSVVAVSVTTGTTNGATDDYDAVLTLLLEPAY